MIRSYQARHAATPDPATRPSVVGIKATAVLSVALLATTAGALVATATASQATTVPHDPIGSRPAVTAAAGGVTISGWAADLDAPATNLRVSVVLDGKTTLAAAPTNLASPATTAKYHVSRTPGYTFTVPVPTGKHVVCLVLDNAGGGLRLLKRCVATPLGRVLTSSQLARRSPIGLITGASATRTSVRLAGWAADPDLVSRRSQVVLYVDGGAMTTRVTKRAAATAARPAGTNGSSYFDISVPVASGTHIVCAKVLNVAFGTDTYAGCRALDTRGAASSGPAPASPALNKSVVALAKKQIGKPYVWGATGSKSFDCSGLVMWSYGKYHYRTPRVSQDQIKAARLIPASRAVPGDLVFYHDSVGDVYHVGIYLSPGSSVAAIDTDQGVDYQRIWDQTATYGSFTHS